MMTTLRKMLGTIDSEECISLMHLMETQSKQTLAAWAIQYAKDHVLGLYENYLPDDKTMRAVILECEQYLRGTKTLKDIKPVIREAALFARNCNAGPIQQAAARGIATACATIQTPTNALGFLFYTAAAIVYHNEGLNQDTAAYDRLANEQLALAYTSLQQAAIVDEAHPAKLKWNC